MRGCGIFFLFKRKLKINSHEGKSIHHYFSIQKGFLALISKLYLKIVYESLIFKFIFYNNKYI